MKPRRLVVLGDGGHANSVAEAAETMGYEISALLEIGRPGESFESVISALEQFPAEIFPAALGLGTNFLRQGLHSVASARNPNRRFPAIVHATAWVSPTATLGDAVTLLSHSTLGAGSRLAVGALLQSGASLDHDSAIGPFGSLGPGARTGGNVVIGDRTAIGLGASILHRRAVGKDSVIGANSLVLEDIADFKVAFGSPVQVARSRVWDEPYY